MGNILAITPGDTLQLVIIGGGDQESALKDRAASLGLAQQITWLGPIHDEMQLAPWFLQSDVFVYPGAIGLSLVQDELAQLLGGSRQRINVELKWMEREGIIGIHQRSIVVYQQDQLEALAQQE